MKFEIELTEEQAREYCHAYEHGPAAPRPLAKSIAEQISAQLPKPPTLQELATAIMAYVQVGDVTWAEIVDMAKRALQ